METVTADAGTAVETGATPGDGIGEDFTLPDNAATSIAPELLATHKASPPTEPTDTGEDADGNEPESAEEPEADPQGELTTWVESLFDNPRSITSVPRARQPEVLQAFSERAVQIANDYARQAYQAGMQAAEMKASTARQIGEIDAALESGDIDGYRELVAKYPGGERGYHAAKAEIAPIRESSPEAFNQRVAVIWQDLADRPDVQEALRKQWNYQASAEGVARLEADIRKLLKSSPARPDPDQRAIEQRRENTQRLKAVPKPDTSPGSGLGGVPSRKEAEALTAEAWARLYDNARKSPEGKAELERWEKASAGR